jgi:hypothetical protein
MLENARHSRVRLGSPAVLFDIVGRWAAHHISPAVPRLHAMRLRDEVAE